MLEWKNFQISFYNETLKVNDKMQWRRGLTLRFAKPPFAGSTPACISRNLNVAINICPGDGMVDIKDLKSLVGNDVRVRVPPWAHEYKILTCNQVSILYSQCQSRANDMRHLRGRE